MSKKKVAAKKINALTRGAIRDAAKENGTLLVYRGRSAIHTSKAEKRRSRIIDRKNAINDNKED